MLDLNTIARDADALEVFCEEYVYSGHGPLWYFKTGVLMAYRRIIGTVGDWLGKDWWP